MMYDSLSRLSAVNIDVTNATKRRPENQQRKNEIVEFRWINRMEPRPRYIIIIGVTNTMITK